MPYTPSRGVFSGRTFESRSDYRRAMADVPGHGESSYRDANERRRSGESISAEYEERRLEQSRADYVQQVLDRVSDYDHPREYRFEYFADQAVMSDRFENADIAKYTMADLYERAVASDWDPSPHGAYAQMLEMAGMREEGAEYPVGETPGGGE